MWDVYPGVLGAERTAVRSADSSPFRSSIVCQRFRGGLAVKAHRLSLSLNSRVESHKEEEKYPTNSPWQLSGAVREFSTYGGPLITP